MNDIKFNIPRIDSIPPNLYELHNYEETFDYLDLRPLDLRIKEFIQMEKNQ